LQIRLSGLWIAGWLSVGGSSVYLCSSRASVRCRRVRSWRPAVAAADLTELSDEQLLAAAGKRLAAGAESVMGSGTVRFRAPP
jgi:hypothetical protein